jgi:peptidoglycan hydrolase-like protein with peptidoglycan-binding domain
MTNPFAGYRVSDDWAAHRSRGSLGGVDFATPVGTPIYAPVAGSVRFEAGNGSGGYIISLALADSPGYVMQFLHCSGFNGSNRSVKAGELLGYTGGARGAPGAGSSTGPHVHVHLVDPNGVREDVMPWFGNSAPSGIAVDGDFGSQTKRALQTALGVPADGDFGPNSTRALQSFLGVTADGSWGAATTRALQGFLGVPADGSFGPQTVRALQASLNGGTFKKVVPAPPAPPAPPVPPKPALTPAQQKRLDNLTARKKRAEAELKLEQDKLPALVKTRDDLAKLVVNLTDVFNKAKLALEKATADVVRVQANRVTAENGVTAVQARVASLQKDVAKLANEISKIKK